MWAFPLQKYHRPHGCKTVGRDVIVSWPCCDSYKWLDAIAYNIMCCARCLMTKTPSKLGQIVKKVIDHELRPFCASCQSLNLITSASSDETRLKFKVSSYLRLGKLFRLFTDDCSCWFCRGSESVRFWHDFRPPVTFALPLFQTV